MLGTYGPLIGVFAALVAAGLGVPIPEDLSMLTAGYLAYRGEASLWVVLPLCFVALLIGDSSLYWLGRRFGERITQHRFLRHHLTPKRLDRVETHFRRHGAKTVFIGRFAAGARALFFVTAGAMGVSYPRFLVFDGIGALFSTLLWVLLGWRFGGQIDRLRQVVHQVEGLGLLAIAAILATWIVARIVRRRIAGPPEPGEGEPTT